MKKKSKKWENDYYLYQGIRIYYSNNDKGVNPIFRNLYENLKYFLKIFLWIASILSIVIGLDILIENLKGYSKLSINLDLFFNIFFAGGETWILWFGILFLSILIFHNFYYKKPIKIKSDNPSFKYLMTQKIEKGQIPYSIDVAKSFNKDSKNTVRFVLDFAKSKKEKPCIYHLIYAILYNKKIFLFFKQKDIAINKFLYDFNQLEKKQKKHKIKLNKYLKKYLIKAFFVALEKKSTLIKPKHILISILREKPFKKVFKKYNILESEVNNI